MQESGRECCNAASFLLVAQCRLAAAMPRAQREVVRPEERAGGDADKYYDRGVTEAYLSLIHI